MFNVQRLRPFATPLTIGCFVLSAVTGISMFFDFDTHLAKELHEWLGLWLVAGVFMHVAINWRPFVKYFKQPLAVVIIVALSALTAFSFISGGGGGDEDRERRRERGGEMRSESEGQGRGQRQGQAGRAVSDALLRAPMGLVAQVAEQDADDLMERLRKAGLKVESSTTTLREVAKESDRSEGEVLAIVFR
jgi:hypothetical protein